MNSKMDTGTNAESSRYPLAASIPTEVLDSDLELLDRTEGAPIWKLVPIYLKLGGPGFLGAALTLGAGTLTASMLAGATFGYRTLWVLVLAMGSGVFMIAAMARFTCRGGVSLIALQKQHHGGFMAIFVTCGVSMVAVAIAFNFGQYAIGTHIIESIAGLAGLNFPQEMNWILYMAITSWLALNYGRGAKGARHVEIFMKLSLGGMFLCFGLTLIIVGIDWHAAVKGLIIPWTPSGQAGIDLFVASSSAAVGVMDWLMFHYAGLSKGWGARHEKLARADIFLGLALPFIAINFLVICVFAGTLYGSGTLPNSATDLSQALMPFLGDSGARIVFLLGFLTVPITTTVGMSIACAIAVHEAMGWRPNVHSWRWRASILLPQIAFLAAWHPRPLFLIIIVAASLSVCKNVVGWSFYLLFNDPAVLGKNRCLSRWWNLGILVQLTLLNLVAITYIFNRLEWW